MIIQPRLESETSKEYAKRMLLNNIISLTFVPGQKINETQLCEELQISRTPIREAILELNQKKMIDIFPKQGTYISYIDPKIIDDIITLRILVESEVSKKACSILTENDLNYLEEKIVLWEHYNTQNNYAKMQQFDKEFHQYIYNRCDKNIWYQIINENSYQFDRVVFLMFKSLDGSLLTADHRNLVNAIREHDCKKAEKITAEHMERYISIQDEFINHFHDYYKS